MLRKYCSKRSGVLDSASTASSLDGYRVLVLYNYLGNFPKMPGNYLRWTSISSAGGLKEKSSSGQWPIKPEFIPVSVA